MQYLDRNSDPTRLPASVRPLVNGMLHNRQIFDRDQDDPSFVTQALKYEQQPQARRHTTEYSGSNQFVHNILDIFDFDPLDFQVNSWTTVDQLDHDRHDDSTSKAAIFSAPTGFGKTEAFLGSLYQLLRDDRQSSAVIVYPSRALLQDQLGRILEHLHKIKTETDSQLSVGVYMGKMPYKLEEVSTHRTVFDSTGGRPRFKLANCWCGDDQSAHAFEYHGTSNSYTIQCEHNDDHRFTERELVLARNELVFESQPDIILTTLESLESFTHKPNYTLLDRLDTIVLDEIHLYTQLRGAHAAQIIQNIDDLADDPLLWLGSSATIDNPDRFGKRIFGLPGDHIETIQPPDSDYDDSHSDKEHYYFLLANEDGPGASPMAIQQQLLLGHSLLEDTDGNRSKLLGFIDSISQVNQKRVQLEDADHNQELWRYHLGQDSVEDWREIAYRMDTRFIDEHLAFMPVYSDYGFDSEETADSDILLSTSFLEVGIDVGEIKIVTQYRTPWNLSSFLQRAGRAARKPGMDSHIVVFLSNLTGDANMFYRADRFLASNIRTPLKTDNKVVKWIHDRLRQFNQRATTVQDNHPYPRNTREPHLAFLEGYLVDDLGFDAFYDLIQDPTGFFEAEFDDELDMPSEPLLSVDLVEDARYELKDYRNRLSGGDLDEVRAFFGMEDDDTLQGADALDQYVRRVQERTLMMINTLEGQLSGYESRLHKADVTQDDEDIAELRNKLQDLRDQAATVPTGPVGNQIETYGQITAELFQHVGQLMAIRSTANAAADEAIPPVRSDDLNELNQAVNLLATVTEDDLLQEYEQTKQRIAYLKETLNGLENYLDYRNPYKSLFAVKDLLRAAYYFNNYLRLDNRQLADEVWFVPPNYFGESGQYVTVYEGENDQDGSQESIDNLVNAYTPYRTEYQSETGKMQAFLPITEVTDDGVQFDFSRYVSGEYQDGILVPDSIRLQSVSDLTDDRALNIVRYCPECFQILTDVDQCLRHEDRAWGKIHSYPNVRTRVTGGDTVDSTGTLDLSDVSAEVALEGVTLDIKPARPMGPEIGLHFDSNADREEHVIKSPDPPLGFRLDTRGLVFDITVFLESLDDDVHEMVSRYKDLEELDFEYVVSHTVAHFLVQLVADVSSVNTTMLLYGLSQADDEVYVFERTEGGQGIVDLVYEELRTDPGSVLESMHRIMYNEQVINERLWATEEFVDDISTDARSEDDVRPAVEDHLSISVESVIERVVQEVVSTVDRSRQFHEEEGLSIREALQVKHSIAAAQIAGDEESPTEAVEALEVDVDTGRAKSLFQSPDIDGCVENLHLPECMSVHDQTESLSYVVLEALRDHLTTTVPTSEATETMFDRELPPAGELDGTSIFLDF